jgi:cytoskeletal protein CcmA (bactofilin family)/DNA-directed RNA polymerase subunit RPC12/RpoP
MAVYECKNCAAKEFVPHRFRLHFGDKARCPKCGTFRIVRLKAPDRIDPMFTGFLNLLEKLSGGRLHHCCFCRIQFYDRRTSHSFVGTRAPVQKAVDVSAALGESTIGELPGDRTLIGTLVMIKGQLLSREDVYLNGQMEGTVEVPECRLTIGPEGRLQANVRAREIVVHGTIRGTVEAAEKIDIRQDAKLVGDIKSGRIIIEDGAYLKGSVDMPTVSNPCLLGCAIPGGGMWERPNDGPR